MAFGTVLSQTPTPKPKDDVVKITTTLIQVDATVLDKNGKVVKDLKAEDFEILENGQKQTIKNFAFVEPPPIPMQKDQPRDKNEDKAPALPIKLRPEQIRRTVALVVDDRLPGEILAIFGR